VHALVIGADALASGEPGSVEVSPETAAPVASVFKLYVLYALADAVARGDVSWDDTLTVTDRVRSLPSGELQDAPTGTEVTVAEAAEKMIAISDNTATDMLIDHLGRERIERAVAETGHHDPAVLTPFLTTREMFRLGWGDPDRLERWYAGDIDERREILAEMAGDDTELDELIVGGDPQWPKGADWFASARDIARVLAALDDHPDPQVWSILSAEPGVAAPGGAQLGFKGGSSLGVLTGTWTVRTEDGRSAYVVLLQSTDDPAGLAGEADEFFRLAESAVAISAR